MIKITLALCLTLLLTLASHANVLFSDSLNYSDGCIETDGLWYCTSSSPVQDALISSNLLILKAGNSDSVAAPTNGWVNSGYPNQLYASFTINVSKLPSATGGYFFQFQDITNNNCAHLFMDTKGTSTPGTYRLGIANFQTSINAAGATNFPMDLATGVTYQVVVQWDETGLGAALWVNPASENDLFVFGNDTTNNFVETLNATEIEFSPFGGTQAIGNIRVGTQFSDADTNVNFAPMIGIQPQNVTNYSGNSAALYTAASGIDVTYQWFSNNIALSDNGVTVVGSQTGGLSLSNLQATANYYVVASDAAGSATSAVAVVSVNTTPTAPVFTLQPVSQTNTLLSPVTLSATAFGTGPINYQWYFEPVGGSIFTALSGQTGSSYTFTAGFANSGTYYVTAIGGAGSTSSTDAVVVVISPQVQSIASVHAYITNFSGAFNINGGQVFNVEGVVTSIGQISSKTVSEFFIQDSSGGCFVYEGAGNTPSNTPPVGALVNVISPAESYYGELEMDPTLTAASNAIIVLSTNNPLPAPQLVDFNTIATNTVGTGTPQSALPTALECSLISLTNVYLYANATGSPLTGTYPVNSSKGLYAFQHPYSAGQPYIEIFVYTYTNQYNLINTNYINQPVPSFAYEITAPLGYFSPNAPEPYPTRFQDIVTNLPPSFSTTVAVTNRAASLSWPAAVGSTYSVYSTTNLLGPWTQTFGLGYYPSIGSYRDTNSAPNKFYKVSSP